MMRTARFLDQSGTVRTGRWTGDEIVTDAESFPVSAVNVLPPTKASKIVGVGPNYYSNIEHYGREEPASPADLVFFVKTMPHAAVGHGGTATLHPPGEFHFEAELGAVIGKSCRDVTSAEALEYVSGYTCVNEITNKGLPDSQYDVGNRLRTKSFDDSAPVGPAVTPLEAVPEDATIELRLNGEVRQRDKISNMIFNVEDLIAEISTYQTLEPGDVIATGSPEGVDRLSDSDHVAVTVDGVGTLEHDVDIPHE